MTIKRFIALILSVAGLASAGLPALAQGIILIDETQTPLVNNTEDLDWLFTDDDDDDRLDDDDDEVDDDDQLPGQSDEEDEDMDTEDPEDGDTDDEDTDEEADDEDTDEEAEEESEETDGEADDKVEEKVYDIEPVTIEDFEWELSSISYLEAAFGDIAITESYASTDFGRHCQKLYSYPDGSYFASRRLYADNVLAQEFELYSTEVECESLTLRYYNTVSNKWITKEILSDSRLAYGMYFLSIDDSEEMVILLPQAYVDKENNAIQAQEGQTGDLCIEPTDNGWRISIMAPYVNSGTFIDFFVMYSHSDTIDWDDADVRTLWQGCQFGGDNRWCYNGYYYTSPSNYIPSGTNYYHRIPAAYIACKFVPMGLESGSARYMCIAMLDVMRDLQNQQGYFPTLSGSQWLLSDYGIGAGFYDTRFNTDLARAFLKAYQNYGIREFWTVVEDYMDYYIPFVLHNHDSVTLSDGWPGWMVYDYTGQYGGKKTHTSLNHQAVQIIFMEEIYQATGNTLVRFLEEMMYRGIQGTERLWYMSNGNLEYAYYNGRAASGMQDYPYLTYNDLYELAELYRQRLGYVPSTVRNLMASKQKWMDANGVTGYKGSYVEASDVEYTGSVVLID